MKRSDMIVVTSEQYLNSSKDLKPFNKKCRAIPLTMGGHRFQNTDSNADDEIRSKYGKDFFLFVGVLRYYKGLEYLLEAMKGIDRKLIIIGQGPEEHALKNKAESLGLDNVVFTGFMDDRYLPAFYKLCRAFVLPSCERSEAFGLSLMEASYFSKPMISTELGTGTSFVNLHNKTGIVVPSKNSDALHRALKQLSEDETLCGQYGENAKKRFDSLFSIETVGQKYLDVYEELYDKKL